MEWIYIYIYTPIHVDSMYWSKRVDVGRWMHITCTIRKYQMNIYNHIYIYNSFCLRACMCDCAWKNDRTHFKTPCCVYTYLRTEPRKWLQLSHLAPPAAAAAVLASQERLGRKTRKVVATVRRDMVNTLGKYFRNWMGLKTQVHGGRIGA